MTGILGDAGAAPVSTSAPADTTTTGTAEVYTPPEWAKGLNVDHEILKSPAFKNFTSVDDVVKSHFHAQKLIGADKVVIPTKASTPEEWKAYYQKAGLPATIEDYKADFPETISDVEFKKSLTNKAFDLNVKPEQLSAIVKELESYNEKIVTEYETEQKAEIEKTLGTLKAEWKGDFDRNIAQANKVIKHFGGDEMLKTVLESPLKNDGNFIKLMATIGGKLLKEDTFNNEATGHFGTSQAEAKSEINKMMGDRTGPYMDGSHPQHAEYVKKMLRFQEILAEKA